MKTEKGDSTEFGGAEREQKPEVIEEIKNLDETAGAVAEQIDGVDLERITPTDKQQLERRLDMVWNVFLVLAGTPVVYEGVKSMSSGNPKDVAVAVGALIAGTGIMLIGVQKFEAAYRKFKGHFTKEELDQDAELTEEA